MKKLSLLLRVLLVMPVFLSGCVAARSEEGETGGSSVSATLEEACSTAGSLVSKDPEQALLLIERIRAPYAPQESAPRTACETQRLAALKAMGEKQRQESLIEPNGAVRSEKAWDAFVKSWVMPWRNLGLALLGVILALLILSRLLALLPSPVMPFRYLPWRHASKLIRSVALVLGLFLVVRCSIDLITLLLGLNEDNRDKVVGQLILLALGQLLGALLLATWMASRPRLSVDVHDLEGKANDSRASNVVALLHELGGGPPRGLEIPRGTDTTGLDDIPLPQTLRDGVLGALQKLLQNIFSLTPWRVIVDATADDRVSVIVTRNGWSAGTTSIDRSNTLIFPRSVASTSKSDDVPPADLYKMAAAFILVTLSRYYQGYKGLGGATDWRSVGLQYLATTDYEGKKEQQIALLSQALELDPANLPAEVALRNLVYRHSEDPKKQGLYQRWLEERLDWFNASPLRRIGQRALLRRLRFSYVSVTMNLIPTETYGEAESRLDLEKPFKEATKLMEGLSTIPMQGESFEKRLRPHAALLLADIERMHKGDHREWNEDWKDWLKVSGTSPAPRVAYNSACSLARRSEHWDKVEPRLDAATIDPNLRALAYDDPELRAYAGKEPRMKEYLKGLEDPKQGCVAVLRRRLEQGRLLKACASEN